MGGRDIEAEARKIEKKGLRRPDYLRSRRSLLGLDACVAPAAKTTMMHASEAAEPRCRAPEGLPWPAEATAVGERRTVGPNGRRRVTGRSLPTPVDIESAFRSSRA